MLCPQLLSPQLSHPQLDVGDGQLLLVKSPPNVSGFGLLHLHRLILRWLRNIVPSPLAESEWRFVLVVTGFVFSAGEDEHLVLHLLDVSDELVLPAPQVVDGFLLFGDEPEVFFL